MKKKSSQPILLILSMLLLVVVLVLVGFMLWNNTDRTPVYHAVYLNTGDMYFGELSRFPRLKLTNTWHLQQGQDGISLNKFSDSAWGPNGTLKLNSEAVVWISRISDDSPLIQAFENQQGPQDQLPASQLPEPTVEADTE